MDKLDIDIICSLNENSRKSYRTLAKELRVSISTISNRLKKLQKDGIIENYIPVINREKIGFDLTAAINIKITHGKLLEVQKEISRDSQVSGVYDITGDWDSLIIAHFKDRRDLNNFIKKILSMDFVERSNTQMVLNVVKDEKRVEL
jgi:DNA-binding Lrp family transcriptional regulator